MKAPVAARTVRAAVLCAGTLGALFAVVSLAAGPLPYSWRYWKYFRPVRVESPVGQRLVSIVLPLDVYVHSEAGLRDLRLVDNQGNEVAYVLHAREGKSTSEPRPGRILEKSFVPGQFTQIVLDVGPNPQFHNAVQLETPEPDFIEWVEAAVSDDAQTWRIVKERAPIFRFSKEAQKGNQGIDYPENNGRYIRLRILVGEKQFPVSGGRVLYHFTTEAELLPLSLPLIPLPAGASNQSIWRTEHVPPSVMIAEVRFAVAQPEFHRAIRIRAADNKDNWVQDFQGEIYRFRQGEKVEERLRFPISVSLDEPLWQVEVLNGNDPPLEGAVPTLYITPYHVVFWQLPGRSYQLLYGQSLAKAPQYDLAHRLDRKAIPNAATGALGPEESNTAYEDPRAWTEKHDLVLWAALGIAVAFLTYSALRALRGADKPSV